jgi:hypothetical protein
VLFNDWFPELNVCGNPVEHGYHDSKSLNRLLLGLSLRSLRFPIATSACLWLSFA